ncbi:alpha/beta-hydrolase [Aulographum hederae CBS 113979]|uniref:Alpha/beta-hydrolase n=1 Tax=Aulographum hederae CBS 113979 TaxID=1176131 RepID=A0A6G1H8H5_9PEZI|nr:alpha/beta-hydrolase [Aulographum hederae CBS 113979]
MPSYSSFGQVPPAATTTPEPFTLNIADDAVSTFKKLLELAPVAPETHENLQEDMRWGVSRKWLIEAKKYALGEFDWRKIEDQVNAFPNYKIPIKDEDGETHSMHFVGLFSSKADAVPIVLLHGWPGSFLEFLPTLTHLLTKYPTPSTLPYNLIIPSLPGYALSSGPPLSHDFTSPLAAHLINELMKTLGYSSYIAQGGDAGGVIARILARTYPACTAVHVNFCPLVPSAEMQADIPGMSAQELAGLGQAQAWATQDMGYAMLQGTKPSTMGLLLSSSPLALLAWVGEKLRSWSDEDPSLEDIVAGVALYWFTESCARNLYPYREGFGSTAKTSLAVEDNYIDKPFGYSWYPKEINPLPKVWAEKAGKLVWFKYHESGGHFAALEKPVDFADALEDFVAKVKSL